MDYGEPVCNPLDFGTSPAWDQSNEPQAAARFNGVGDAIVPNPERRATS